MGHGDVVAGLGHLDMSATALPVRGDLAGVKVTQVTTYGDCSLAVSAEGQLYGWGNSEYLQLACVTEATQVTQCMIHHILYITNLRAAGKPLRSHDMKCSL